MDASLLPVSIGARPLCNLRFANDIDLLGGSEEELQQFAERLEKTAADYGVEISSDKMQYPLQQQRQKQSNYNTLVVHINW